MFSFNNFLNFLKERKNNAFSAFRNWRNEIAWPSLRQWKQFFKILSKGEKYFFLACGIIFVSALFIIARAGYLNTTEIKPAYGGDYAEAAIGFPRYLNPILASTNDVDRDVSSILFSSLFRRNENGDIAPELAEKFTVSDDRKNYDIELKKSVKWHDEKDLTVDDVIYTVNVIQDPDYRSPLRNSLLGVEIEKISDNSIRFKLKNPYDPFLDNLTFGILPKHIWENTPPTSFPLSENNLKPIGSGPYKFSKLQKDGNGSPVSLELTHFSEYFQGRPFIDNISFQFYKDEDSAINSFNNESMDGISYVSGGNVSKIIKSVRLNKFVLPRYFAVFFNTAENKVLADKNVRQALADSADKNAIVDKVAAGEAIPVNSPLPNFIFGQSADRIDKYPDTFNPDKAASLLESNGWTIPSSTTTPAIRQKTITADSQNIPIEINLLTVNWPELIEVADILKENWQKLGIAVNIDVQSVADIQEKIKSRQYQALLFGQILGANPDPFSFWHSSQKNDPGLNLALYDNKDADKLLENVRKEPVLEIKIQEYNQLQKLITQDVPAVFLYSPVYIFPTSGGINGVSLEFARLPQDRFAQIAKWYIETKRAWR